MNQELAAANEQLKDYARTVEELAVSQERNRIARDIHDTLGHTMTLILALLEVSVILYEQDPKAAKVKLLEANRITKDGIKELRRSIRQKTGAQDLLESLHQLIAGFKSSGLQIDFSVEGGKDYLQPQYSEVIYRLCQEALTNAVRHGKAKRVVIILNFENQLIKLFIFDDGQGCQSIIKGMGLTGMEQRVQELKGTIEYGSNGEIGFNINVEIPII
jgi:signal transduction histidine kinase